MTYSTTSTGFSRSQTGYSDTGRGYDERREEKNSKRIKGRNITNDVDETTDRLTVNSAQAHSGQGQVDRRLLDQIIDTLSSLDSKDLQSFALRIDSIAGMVCELWLTCASASQYHRATLAALEAAILQIDPEIGVTEDQIGAMRSATIDLIQRTLTSANVESTNSLMIDAGFSPMAALSAVEND